MGKQVSSLQNPLVKSILLLQEKPRERKSQNLFVMEGVREISLAFQSGFALQTLLYCPEILGVEEAGSDLLEKTRSIEQVEVTREVFNRLAYRADSGGMIATATPRRYAFSDLELGTSPLLLVLETVEKPGNLGALLRTADAAGLDAVIICDPQTDIYNPNAVRSSLGCIFTLPVVTSSTPETLEWLRVKGIRSFATALTATHLYHETDYRGPSAIIMGSEAFGLSRQWLDGADEMIKIPMMGKVDSMNVSASAAIMVYEAMRQRGFRIS